MDRLTAPPWQAATLEAILGLQARGVQAALVHGQAGTGKLLAVLDGAQALLCEALVGGRACGRCTGCRLFLAGSHPDLRIVVPEAMLELVPTAERADDDGAPPPGGAATSPSTDGADGDGKGRRSREIRIEQVRELADLATLSAHRSGRRIVVLGPAEALNVAAANAALKLLEEPPPGMMFLLVTDALDDVLATIRSRCVLVRGGRPDAAAAEAWLRQHGVAEPAIALAEAGGAPLVALRQGGRPVLEEAARRALVEMLRSGADLSTARIAAEVPRTVAIAPACQLMQRWAWDVIARQRGAPVRYHVSEAAAIERLAARAVPSSWMAWLAQLERIRADAEHPLNGRLVVEAALLGYVRAASGG